MIPRDLLVQMPPEGRAAEVKIILTGISIARAFRTNVVEENQHRLSAKTHEITVPVKPFEIVTVRVECAAVQQGSP